MRRDVNFFNGYHEKRDFRAGAEPVTVVGIIAVCASLVVVAGLYSALRAGSMLLDRTSAQQLAYIDGTTVSQAQQTLSRYQGKINALNGYTGAVSGALKEYQAVPAFNSKLLESVIGAMPADMIIGAFRYQNGRLTLDNCRCTSPLTPYSFVHTLRSDPYLTDISYGGYTLSGTGYNFKVECTVRAVKSNVPQ